MYVHIQFKRFFHILGRYVENLDSFFTNERDCDGRSTIEPMPDCVLHPTMMCNYVINCPNCIEDYHDETSALCHATHCKNSNVIYSPVYYSW